MFSRTSRILLVAALLLVGAYLLIERPRQRAAEKGEEKSERVASFDAASIDSVVLERSQDTLRFTKADSLWRIAAPLTDAAEPAAIATLLDALNTADIDRNLGAEKNLVPYGLDHPDVVITILSAHRIVLQVSVGKHTVDDAWCYARESTGDVLLIPTDVHHSSTLPLDAYRDRRVLAFQVRDVTTFGMRTPAGRMSWTRHGRGWFTVSTHDTLTGDSVGVESPLHRLRGLRVASFLAPGDTLATPMDSTRTMTLWMGRGHRVILRFTRAGNQWRARDAAGERNMVIAEDISDLFMHTTTELRDRRILQFDPSVAERITFASTSVSGELIRAGGRWSFPNPAAGRVDPERAADFVRALRSLKWDQPAAEKHEAVPVPAQFDISVHGAGDRIIDEFSAGPRAGGAQWIVTSRSSHGTWLINGARLDELSGRFLRIKTR